MPTRPLLFEPAADAGGFQARGPNFMLRFTKQGFHLSGPDTPSLLVSFAGARAVAPTAEGPSVSETNYFVGAGKSQWRTGVPNYERLRYSGLYPGVDLVVYSTDKFFEYDLELAPFADPSQIRMRVQGSPRVALDSAGDLLLGPAGFRFRRPRVTQGEREIAASFRIGKDGLVGFELGEYDRAKPLVIDPIITFSTLHGGTWGESTNDMAVDREGNMYIAGYTASDVFPGPLSFGELPRLRQWGFVSKLAPVVDGKSRVLYTIFLGSNVSVNSLANAQGVAVDGLGNVIVVGVATAGFPIRNAAQSELGGGDCMTQSGSGGRPCPDGFLAKFAPDGRTLLFSTYFGGPGQNTLSRVAADAAGDIYAVGWTASTSLQGTAGAVQRAYSGGARDGQLVRFSSAGQLLYSTFLGGAGDDDPWALTLEAPGVIWIAGETSSSDLPTAPNAYQPTYAAFRRSAFVARIDTRLAGSAGLTYSTFFGNAPGNSVATGIFRDSSGQVVFCGSSYDGVPATTPTAFQPRPIGRPLPSPPDLTLASGDAFIARLNPQLSGAAQLTYSSHIGGTGAEDNVRCGEDASGNFIVAGDTSSGAPFFTHGSPLPYKNFGDARNRNLFLIRIDPRVAGSPQSYQSILFGGNTFDNIYGFAMDSSRRFAYLAGRTGSTVFPVSQGAPQRTYGGNTLSFGGGDVDPATGGGDTWLTQVDVTATQENATRIAMRSGDYQFVNPGGTLPVSPAVHLLDASNRRVFAAGYNMLITGSNVEVPLNFPTLTDADGIAAVSVVRIPRAGSAVLELRVDRSAPPVTFNFKAIEGALPTSAAIVSGASQNAAPGAQLPEPLVVELRDAANQPRRLAGVPIRFLPENATVSAGVVETGADGRASVRVTLGTQPGLRKVDVAVGTFPLLTANFSGPGPAITAAGVVNAATFAGGSVSPGLIVTIFGQRIGPPALQAGSGGSGRFPVALGETRVLFDGVPAPLLYVSAGQTSAIVPYAVAGKASTVMTVEYQGMVSNSVTIPVAAARPGLFSANATGSGQGALLNEDNTVNSAANPLARGKIAVLFATGEGVTTPAGVDGQIAASVFPKPVLPVRVKIGGVDAEVLYAGAAPTLVAGVLQVNVRVPDEVPDGDAIVELFIGDAASPATITMAVRGD